MLNFDRAFDAFVNQTLPTKAVNGTLVAPFWDDLVLDGPLGNQNAFFAVTGIAPHRELVIEWRNVPAFSTTCPDNTKTVTFQVVFFEGRTHILFNYADVTFGSPCSSLDGGASATVGVQSSPTVAHQFSFNAANLNDSTALLWTLPGVSSQTFTDDPLMGGSTLIKAVHITELRSRIDALRVMFGRAPMVWADATIVPNVTVPKAQHLLDMRLGIIEAYQAAGLGPPSFTDLTIQPGQTAIRAVHIAELRAAVTALEGPLSRFHHHVAAGFSRPSRSACLPRGLPRGRRTRHDSENGT